MAFSMRLRPLLPFSIAAGFATSSILLLRPIRRPILCESPSLACPSIANGQIGDVHGSIYNKGQLNPQTLKQLSTGSLLGLASGVVVSAFSKPLALLIGLLIFGVQFLESRGIHVIPYSRLQAHFKNIDLRSAMQSDVTFKLSFGATFLLATFAKF